MRRFIGLLYHEILLLKPFLIIAIIVNVLCIAAVQATALILRYAVGVSEYSKTMMVVIVAVIFPAALNMLPAAATVWRYENNIAKRNRFTFSLPGSKLEVVLSRALIPTAFFFAYLILAPVSINLYRLILGFDELLELIAVSYIIIFAFSLLFSLFLLIMFISAKELIFTAAGFGVSMFLLSRSGSLWKRLFENTDFESNAFYQIIADNFWLGFCICLCVYLASLIISYHLAGRREKLCEA